MRGICCDGIEKAPPLHARLRRWKQGKETATINDPLVTDGAALHFSRECHFERRFSWGATAADALFMPTMLHRNRTFRRTPPYLGSIITGSASKTDVTAPTLIFKINLVPFEGSQSNANGVEYNRTRSYVLRSFDILNEESFSGNDSLLVFGAVYLGCARWLDYSLFVK